MNFPRSGAITPKKCKRYTVLAFEQVQDLNRSEKMSDIEKEIEEAINEIEEIVEVLDLHLSRM